MRSGRFFVTYVCILGIVVLVACNVDAKREGRARATSLKQRSLVDEGNAQIHDAAAVDVDLNRKYPSIALNLKGDEITKGRLDWKAIPLSERREIQGKLAQFLVSLNRVLQIDAQRNITVDNREQILTARDNAVALQKSAEKFEKEFGESFDSTHATGARP